MLLPSASEVGVACAPQHRPRIARHGSHPKTSTRSPTARAGTTQARTHHTASLRDEVDRGKDGVEGSRGRVVPPGRRRHGFQDFSECLAGSPFGLLTGCARLPPAGSSWRRGGCAVARRRQGGCSGPATCSGVPPGRGLLPRSAGRSDAARSGVAHLTATPVEETHSCLSIFCFPTTRAPPGRCAWGRCASTRSRSAPSSRRRGGSRSTAMPGAGRAPTRRRSARRGIDLHRAVAAGHRRRRRLRPDARRLRSGRSGDEVRVPTEAAAWLIAPS